MSRQWHRNKLPKEMGEVILWHVLQHLLDIGEFEAYKAIYNLIQKHFVRVQP